MNLRSVDLNLLVILDALLDEAHVSRAADRLGLSQPATSAALQRCRELFGDPLLERGRGTMRPTARAERLRAPLRAWLATAERLLDHADTPLDAIRRTIRLALADFPAVVLLGPLQRDLARTAPGIDLVIQPWQGGEAARDALIAGATDIALSVFPRAEAEIHREELLQEHFVVAMRRDHPAAADFGLAAWLAHPHVVVSGRGDPRGPVDEALAARGLARRVGLVVPSFGMVGALLADSDLLALLPSRCVPADARLRSVPPPLPLAGFTLHLAWHHRRREDRAVRHVADLLARLLR